MLDPWMLPTLTFGGFKYYLFQCTSVFYVAPSNSAYIFKPLIIDLLLASLFHSSELCTLFNLLPNPPVLVPKDHISSLALIAHWKCNQTALKQRKLLPSKSERNGGVGGHSQEKFYVLPLHGVTGVEQAPMLDHPSLSS